MADNRPGGEPTEAPTPKRLRDARDKGQVARSAELTAALGFAGGCAALLMMTSALFAELLASVAQGIELAAGAPEPSAAAPAAMRSALDTVLRASLPVAGAAALLAAAGGFLQNPGLFTTAPLVPDLNRINPLEGVKRIFSANTAVELVKSLAKLALVGVVVYDVLVTHAPFVPRLVSQPASTSFVWVGSVAATLVFRVVLLYAVIGVADYLWQRRRHFKQLMMTKEEVKKEYKESEGDPQHKAERKRVHQEVLQHQMVESVRSADAVIINPTHIAVALRYDEESMEAPTVVARGERLVAQQIKEVARKYGVPVYRDVPLARSLVQLELGQEIPEALFEAVAVVLRFVYDQSSEAGR